MIARMILVAALLAPAAAVTAQSPPKPKPPRVEVVFVLDTTGSMGGLIDSARKKIWSIATEIERGKPTPDLYVGLVAYRDKGDEYVTAVTGLTDNLDGIYGVLTGYRAGGGGDGPENVRQALHDALTKIEWSRDKETLRIIFLAGDWPPHVDYNDVPTVDELCLQAAKSETIINTIRLGGNEETGRVWQHIAAKSEGKYVSIDQDGGVVAVATPFDEELGKLSDKLGGTAVAFGSEERRKAFDKAEEAAAGYAGDAKADRAALKATAGRYGADDLVDAVREGSVKLEDVKDEELPEELRKMSLEERRAFVEKKAKEREELRAQILELSKKREAFIAEELKKRGARDAFDQVVFDMIHEQAKRKGIGFEEK